MTSELTDRERSSILAGLESSDDELRRLTVERLLALPSREAIPHLIHCLGDSSWRVRKAGVERIVVCGNQEFVCQGLIEALSDGDNSGRRNSAVEALIILGEDVVPMLIEAMSNDDVDVRKLIVDAIAGIGGGTARQSMIAALSDSDANVRAAAADALGVISGEGVIDVLLNCGTNPAEDQLVRFSALRALIGLEAVVTVGQLAGALEDPVLATAGYSLLGYIEGDDATEALLKGLEAGSRACRESAMEALLRVLSRRDGDDSDRLIEQIRAVAESSEVLISSAIDHLPHVDLAVRLVLVQFLGLVGTPESIIAILEAGRDEAISEVSQATLQELGPAAESAVDAAWNSLDAQLRRDACSLLGRSRDGRGGERLLEAFASTDAELRVSAAKALASSGRDEAMPRFVSRLEIAAMEQDIESDEECQALEDAIVSLIEASASPDDALVQETVELLSDRLEGTCEEVRLAVSSVLGRIVRSEELGLVTSLLKDSSPRVRRVGVESLARIATGDEADPLRLALADESPMVRISAAAAIASFSGERVVEDLERLVNDEDRWVRAATMRAIGAYCENHRDRIDTARELALVKRGLSDEPAVAVAAVGALRLIGGPDASKMATQLLQHSEPELVQAAIGCVGVHGGSEDLLEVLPLISHESWSVRAEAIQVLSDRRVPQSLPAILRRLENEQDSFVRDAILHGLKRLEA